MAIQVPANIAHDRTASSLTFRWAAVPTASEYETQLTAASGTLALSVQGTEVTFTGLVPNCTYRFHVRARCDADVSEYSAPLETCTTVPPPPVLSISPLPGLAAGVIIHWDWSTLVMDMSDPVSTEIARTTADSSTVLHTSPLSFGSYVDMSSAAGASYALALASHKHAAPGGMNRSQGSWQTTVFVPIGDRGPAVKAPHELLLHTRIRSWN